MDSINSKVDSCVMVFSVYGKFIWSKLGLRGIGLGWILGVGSRRECSLYAAYCGDRVLTFSHDSRKKRYDEGMEYVTHPSHICDDYIWNIYYSKWTYTIRPYFR